MLWKVPSSGMWRHSLVKIYGLPRTIVIVRVMQLYLRLASFFPWLNLRSWKWRRWDRRLYCINMCERKESIGCREKLYNWKLRKLHSSVNINYSDWNREDEMGWTCRLVWTFRNERKIALGLLRGRGADNFEIVLKETGCANIDRVQLPRIRPTDGLL
jgi:hypothetical protein